MLKEDQRDYLNQVNSGLNDANNQYLQSRSIQNFEILKKELVRAKETFESLIDEGQGDQWFDKKLSNIRDDLQSLERFEKEQKNQEAASQDLFAYSERGINKTLLPISKATREIKFPIELEINGEKYSTTNCWEARHFMTMDALAYLTLKKLGFPRKAQTIFDNVGEIEKRAEILKSEDIVTEHQLEEDLVSSFKNVKYWVRFDAEFFREFTGKRLETQQITELLTETACKFTLSYPVLLRDKKKRIKESKYRVSVHTSFFTLAYIDALDKNDKTKKRTFYAFFNTGLGECFVNNLLAKGYDMIDARKFYSLPSLAQMFFRKFILHHSHFGPIRKSLGEIRKGLNLKIRGDSDLISYLRQKVLDPLKKNGDLSGYHIKKELNEYWIYFQRSDQKFKAHQEALKSPGEKKAGSGNRKLKSRQFHSEEMVEVNGVKKWPEETDEY